MPSKLKPHQNAACATLAAERADGKKSKLRETSKRTMNFMCEEKLHDLHPPNGSAKPSLYRKPERVAGWKEGRIRLKRQPAAYLSTEPEPSPGPSPPFPPPPFPVPPVQEPEPDRLPDEAPRPNPDENDNPKKYLRKITMKSHRRAERRRTQKRSREFFSKGDHQMTNQKSTNGQNERLKNTSVGQTADGFPDDSGNLIDVDEKTAEGIRKNLSKNPREKLLEVVKQHEDASRLGSE